LNDGAFWIRCDCAKNKPDPRSDYEQEPFNHATK
jgi:hypothetical protein